MWLDGERALRPKVRSISVATGLTIAEAARATGVSAHTLRYYEATERERLALLEEHRAAVQVQLDEVRGHLEFIDRKITTYEDRLHG